MGDSTKSIIPEAYHITPDNIDTSRHFLDTFGKLEREVFAAALVIYCQYKGYWVSMDQATIEGVCTQLGAKICFLDWFLEKQLIVCDRHGDFCLTEEFVKRCYKVSPKKI